MRARPAATSAHTFFAVATCSSEPPGFGRCAGASIAASHSAHAYDAPLVVRNCCPQHTQLRRFMSPLRGLHLRQT